MISEVLLILVIQLLFTVTSRVLDISLSSEDTTKLGSTSTTPTVSTTPQLVITTKEPAENAFTTASN